MSDARDDKDDALSTMVDRFLAWPLPKSVSADGCATNPNYPHPRSGTNLLTHDEARQMLMHVAKPMLDAKQAVIDRLMLEYCPEEMTEGQVREWGEHQRPVSAEEEIGVAVSAERASLREKIKNDPELPCEAGPMLEPVDLRAAIDEAIRQLERELAITQEQLETLASVIRCAPSAGGKSLLKKPGDPAAGENRNN